MEEVTFFVRAAMDGTGQWLVMASIDNGHFKHGRFDTEAIASDHCKWLSDEYKEGRIKNVKKVSYGC